MAPMLQVLNGKGAVPVWFVKWDEMEPALDDGLKIGELAGLPSLVKGSASFYHETLHPYGGSIKNHMVLDAQGLLETGTGFNFHAEHTEANFKVSIKFK